VGWSVYGESLDVYVFAGAALIIAGVLWNLYGEARPLSRRVAMPLPRDV